MQIEKVFQDIESIDFAAKLGVASNLRTLIGMAFEFPFVRELEDEIRSSKTVALQLLQRITKISDYQVDIRYQNMLDHAITIYLYLLKIHYRDIAEIAATTVQKIPQCWWGNRMSREILIDKPVDSGEAYSVQKENVKLVEPVFVAADVIEQQFFSSPLRIYIAQTNAYNVPEDVWKVRRVLKTPKSSEQRKKRDFVERDLFDRQGFQEKMSWSDADTVTIGEQ